MKKKVHRGEMRFMGEVSHHMNLLHPEQLLCEALYASFNAGGPSCFLDEEMERRLFSVEKHLHGYV